MATTGDGERFAWSGKISVNPPRSAGTFTLLGIPLKKYSPYLAEFARIEVTDGVLGVGANYRFDADAAPLELEVTNAAASDLARAPGRSTEPAKGATRLIQAAADAAAAKVATTSTSPNSSAAPAKPKTEDELIRDELEHRLAAATPATDDDLRELMQRRAESVQKFLLDTGKVTADRLFLVAPKPADPAVKGGARATFSLD